MNFKLVKLNFVYTHVEKKIYDEMAEREENTNLEGALQRNSKKDQKKVRQSVVGAPW